MHIIIDAMGGDNAPAEIVRGAVEASREFGAEISLVGIEAEIRTILDSEGAGADERVHIVPASEVSDMEDDPSSATRKKPDSSMAVALRLLHEGKGDAVISAGSTGALLSGATLTVRRIKGIRRACFGPVLPNGNKGVLLIDCGANVECTAEYLLQFAYMGKYYMQELCGCTDPRVGLLNIGVEETKGTELQKQTYALLEKASEEGRIRFVGNVEAREALSGSVDVLVCDGFSGNVLLKGIEGTASTLMKELKAIFYKNLTTKLAAALLKKDLMSLRSKFDSSEVGGTVLLGICRPVIKAHGSSDAHAIRSAVRQAIDVVNADVIGKIEKNVQYMRIITTNEGES